MSRNLAAIIMTACLVLAGLPAYRAYRAQLQNDAPEGRIAAYDAQVKTLSELDRANILYHETATITLDGTESLKAIAVDAGDRIYAGGGRRILVLTPQGEEIRRIDTEANVTCLAVEEEQTLYAGLGNTVKAYDAAGAPGVTFKGLPEDSVITSLAVVQGGVFVADARSRTVRRFDRDGALALTINGSPGNTGESAFVVPSPYFDLTAGQGGTLWIVNPGMHRLEEYDLDGVQIDSWQREASMKMDDFCGCCNPAHISRLSDGSLVTSEKGILRIKIYSRRGVFSGVVATPDEFDSQTPSLDVAVDSHDRILVADPVRRQVRVFERK